MTASGGFGRRRFDIGSVDRTDLVPSSSHPLVSSSSEAFSSISSRFLIGVAPGKRSRLDNGEACCVTAAALSIADFWVEPKLNIGAGTNC